MLILVKLCYRIGMDYFEKIELELAQKEPDDIFTDTPPKQNWVSRLSFIWLLGLWLISQNMISIFKQPHDKTSLWKISLFLLIFIACVWLAYGWARKYQLIPAINWRYFQLGKIAAGFGMMFATAVISSIVMYFSGTNSTENQELLKVIGKNLPPLVFFIMTTSAGFFEELIFRVGPFELLFNKWPKIAAIVAWGLFTAVHVPTDIPSFITYGLMSLVLTGLYAKYRNFYLNMSVHFLWNTFGVIGILMSM